MGKFHFWRSHKFEFYLTRQNELCSRTLFGPIQINLVQQMLKIIPLGLDTRFAPLREIANDRLELFVADGLPGALEGILQLVDTPIAPLAQSLIEKSPD